MRIPAGIIIPEPDGSDNDRFDWQPMALSIYLVDAMMLVIILFVLVFLSPA